MFIIRHKRGFTIRLSEDEMSMLRIAVDRGITDLGDGHMAGLTDTELSILNSERWEAIRGPLTTDKDCKS